MTSTDTLTRPSEPAPTFEGELYPGQVAEQLAELVCRVKTLGGFDTDNVHLAALVETADRLVATVDPSGTLAQTERCEVCAAPVEIESWDTPVAYCPNDCDPPA